MQTLYGGKTLISSYKLLLYRKRITNNQHRDGHSGPLFKKSKIPKFEYKILIGNITFISKSINNCLPPIFKSWFIFCSEIHNYDTVLSSIDKSFKPFCRTDSFGKNSIITSAINCWKKNPKHARESVS